MHYWVNHTEGFVNDLDHNIHINNMEHNWGMLRE